MDRKSIQGRADQMKATIEETDRLLHAIEGARMQLSSTGDELRGQTTVIKARLVWLIEELDELKKLLEAK